MRLEALSGDVPPTELHFVRSHFAVPDHPGTLTIGGEVRNPLTLNLADLRRRPAVTLANTPRVRRQRAGVPRPARARRAVAPGGRGDRGVDRGPAGRLLEEAGVTPGAVEILFRGADSGTPGGLGRTIAFERSLPLPIPPDAIVAFAMNGRPLPPEHGAPLRLVVPGWYGVASVKWLVEIRAIATPFRGFSRPTAT